MELVGGPPAHSTVTLVGGSQVDVWADAVTRLTEKTAHHEHIVFGVLMDIDSWTLIGRTDGPIILLLDDTPGVLHDICQLPQTGGLPDALTAAAQSRLARGAYDVCRARPGASGFQDVGADGGGTVLIGVDGVGR
jgi:hypothetical protein